MAETINVTSRLDKEVKENDEKMFNDFGMNLSTRLLRSIADAEAGNVTVHELIEED